MLTKSKEFMPTKLRTAIIPAEEGKECNGKDLPKGFKAIGEARRLKLGDGHTGVHLCHIVLIHYHSLWCSYWFYNSLG